MSPLSSVRGTGGSINDIAVNQNQNTLTHPKDHTKGEYTTITTGTGSWTVPPGVTKICIVVIGAGGGGAAVAPYKGCGGGGGGGLSWGNNITVKPGDSLPYSVGEGGTGNYSATGGDGGDTWIKDAAGTTLLFAEGGEGGSNPSKGYGGNGGYTTAPWVYGTAIQGGGVGGPGGAPHPINAPTFHFSKGSGGGGAGGYEGGGGEGGWIHQGGPGGTVTDPAGDGYGGAGGGGQSGWGGGGVGLYGEGISGEGGTPSYPGGGEGGSPAATNTDYAKNTANEPGVEPVIVLNTAGGGVKEGEGGASAGDNICRGGGGAGGNFFPPDPGAGEDGAGGGLRICWGCGVSFPDNADGHYPTPS